MKSGLIAPPGVGRTISAMPCSTESMAMVVITALIWAKRTRTPLTRPTTSADADAGQDAQGPACRTGAPVPRRKEAATTVRLISEPTETSSPRTSSTCSCAIATKPAGAAACRMCWMLIGFRKTSLSHGRKAADQRASERQEDQRHPPDGARHRPACRRRGDSGPPAASASASSWRPATCQEGGDDLLLVHIVAGQLPARSARARRRARGRKCQRVPARRRS